DYFLRATAVSPLGFVDEVLCYVYQHEGSLGTGCQQKIAYMNRWRLHKKIKRLFAKHLKTPEVERAWLLQQADLYRNLSVLSLEQGDVHRAKILFYASLKFRKWQFGVIKLWAKIMWVKAAS
ncbi:MAG: hypothetical protein R8M46_03855, partial [Ghiorsea sp.]